MRPRKALCDVRGKRNVKLMKRTRNSNKAPNNNFTLNKQTRNVNIQADTPR